MEGKKNGYIFAISGCDSTHYKVAAEPEVPNSGQRAFCSDEGGAIRAAADGKATTCLSRGETIQKPLGGVAGGISPAYAQPGTTQLAAPAAQNGPANLGSSTRRQRVRVSASVTQGLLLSKVQPEYPQMAKVARVQGLVVMHAVIGTDGNIQTLDVIDSPSPLLNQAALDAVKQWKYKPYLLNGNPVEVDTQITVNFSLVPR
jgi:TonB family protein